MDYLISVALISMSALFSGLTLGLMSLDIYELKRKMKLGDKKAEKVYSVRKKGNLLLVTLILGNTAINAILSVFLGSVTSGVMAVVTSTILITLFGEVAPQAVFSKFAMELGAKTAWLVRIFIILFYPLCAPVAWLLDKTLGRELPAVYSRLELIEVLNEHQQSPDSDIEEDEHLIATGALSFGDKTLESIMTPWSVVSIANTAQTVQQVLADTIIPAGISRLPVVDGKTKKILGILLVKDLLSFKKSTRIIEIELEKPILRHAESKLDIVLNELIKKRQHLCVVVDQYGQYIGIVSLEDIVEEILGREIVDEYDKYANLQVFAKKLTKS